MHCCVLCIILQLHGIINLYSSVKCMYLLTVADGGLSLLGVVLKFSNFRVAVGGNSIAISRKEYLTFSTID